jgi:lysophospholipase L1-like esterase
LKKTLRPLLFAAYLLVATAILLEIAVRLWGYSERHIYDSIYVPFPASEDIPYVHKPNLVNAKARGLAVINTDSLGLRSPRAGEEHGARQANEFRIAVTGDSVTFGEGVTRTEDTYPQVLQDVLNQEQATFEVKVFNFGASAYSVKEMTATLEHRMLALEPDLVLMAIVPTDFHLPRTPALSRWGYFTERSGFLSRDSYVRLLIRKLHLAYPLRDMIYPNVQASPGQTSALLLAGGLPGSYSYLRKFAETADRSSTRYRIVLLPSPASFGKIAGELDKDAVAFVDLTGLQQEFSPEQYRATRFDPHPSAAVHRRIGEKLAAHILENRLLSK